MKAPTFIVLGLFLAAFCFSGSTPLRAKSHPEIAPVDDTLQCTVTRGGVALEWHIVFVAPIQGFVLSRDGAGIAKLDPEESSYLDAEAGPGEHTYGLEAINFNGDILSIGKCAVTLPQPGLRCAAEENRVHLEWGPILIDVLILKFRISRNGEAIDTVPPDQLKYDDVVHAAGAYKYEVHAVTNPDSEFLIGSCAVDVTCFLLEVSVGGLTVKLDWSRVPLPLDPTAIIIAPTFLVTRNNELVVKTKETSHVDTVPAAGEYHYQVFMDFGTGGAPVIPVAACLVKVSGEQPPAPQDLVCRVIIPVPEPVPLPIDSTDPAAIDLDGDGKIDGVFPIAAVHLKWTNPARYDKILILRNGLRLADLGGEVEKYGDQGVDPGVYIYEVIAVRNGQRSLPASCQVVVPGPPRRNLLYFSPGIFPVDVPDPEILEPIEPIPLPPLPGNRITCIANNAKPVQGWSFGAGSDPQFLVAESIDLRRTITKTFNNGTGPDFLHMEIVGGGAGVVMAAVLSAKEPFEVLPSDRGHRLLNIEYGAGPAGVPGQAYPIRYTNTLGNPPVQILFVVEGFEVKVDTLPGWASLPGPRFIRGNVNGDNEIDQSDAIVILKYLFLGGEPIGCLEAANVNGTREVNIADPIYLLNWKFIGGPAPPPPFPRCGFAPIIAGCETPSLECN